MEFGELAAGWFPYAVADLRRCQPQTRGRTLPDALLQEYNIFVACQSDDDIP